MDVFISAIQALHALFGPIIPHSLEAYLDKHQSNHFISIVPKKKILLSLSEEPAAVPAEPHPVRSVTLTPSSPLVYRPWV